MATKPEKPEKSNPGATASHFLLEPLPQPDVRESDTDTAWGLWELSLQGESQRVPVDEHGHVDFQDTEPLDPSARRRQQR